MKPSIVAIAVAMVVALTGPAATQAAEELEATHRRVGKIGACVPKEPTADLEGTYRGEFVTSVVAIRLFRKRDREGAFVTYCLEVTNGWDTPRGHTQPPSGNGFFRLPWLVRRHAESIQIAADSRCSVHWRGLPNKGQEVWRKYTRSLADDPPIRHWHTFDIRKAASRETVEISWEIECSY